MRPAGLVLLLAACGAPPRKEPASARPDEQALGQETFVKAEKVRLLLSGRWRAEAKLEGVRIERAGALETARGSAVLRLRALRVEAREIEVKWLDDYEDLMLYAEKVELFRQQRGERPYGTENVAVLSLANDKVSFLQQ